MGDDGGRVAPSLGAGAVATAGVVMGDTPSGNSCALPAPARPFSRRLAALRARRRSMGLGARSEPLGVTAAPPVLATPLAEPPPLPPLPPPVAPPLGVGVRLPLAALRPAPPLALPLTWPNGEYTSMDTVGVSPSALAPRARADPESLPCFRRAPRWALVSTAGGNGGTAGCCTPDLAGPSPRLTLRSSPMRLSDRCRSSSCPSCKHTVTSRTHTQADAWRGDKVRDAWRRRNDGASRAGLHAPR